MRGSIYVSAVGCLLLSLAQRVALEEEGSSETSCQPLTKASMSVVCKNANGEKQSCHEPGINSTVNMTWKRKIIKRHNGTGEMVCQSGEWKKPTPMLTHPPGYQELPGIGVYKLYTIRLTWYDALVQCLADGAYLVVIDSLDELTALKLILSEIPREFYRMHIGIHDILSEGSYRSVLGAPYTIGHVLKFGKKEPDGKDKQNCILMTGGDFLVHDGGCFEERYFMCEAFRTTLYNVTLIPNEK